ncbi:MAG: condensation domain-containing protein [Oscillospiraceae bacterium]|nr:condensation domain-containing protein [Oscillospiraceae bacterium]
MNIHELTLYRDETGASEFKIGNRQRFMVEMDFSEAEKNGGIRAGSMNFSQCMRLKFPLDTDRLEKAVQKVIDENDALRVVLIKKEDGFYEKVVEHYPFKLNILDAQTGSPEENLEKAKEIAMENLEIPFDMYNELSIRLFLIKLGENDHLMVWIAHHWIGDGSTSGLVIDQIFRYYEDINTKIPDHATFMEFIKEEYAFEKTDKGLQQIEYWRKELGDYKKLDMTKTLIGERASGEDRFRSFSKEKPDTIAKAFRTSRFNVMLMAFHVAVSAIVGADDTLIGIANANRTSRKFLYTVGYLAHPIQHRIRTTDSDKLSDLMIASKKKFSENMSNAKMSYFFDSVQFCITYQNFIAGAESKEQNIIPVSIPSKRVMEHFYLVVFENENDISLCSVSGPTFTDKFYESLIRYMNITVDFLITDGNATVADVKKKFCEEK